MTNRQGQTALYFAAQTGRPAVVRFLLERGADVNVIDNSGKSLIDAAGGNEEVVALLRGAVSPSR